MKSVSSEKGLTLIEVIISLAILGIIVVAFSGVFSSGLKGIFFAGHKSKAENVARQTIEDRIAGKNTAVTNTTTTVTNSALGIIFTDSTGTVTVPVNVNGKVFDVDYDDGKRTVLLKTFTSN